MWKRMPFFPVGYTNFKNAVSLAGFFTTVGQVSFASLGWDRSSWGQGNCMQGSDSAVIQLPPLHSFSLGNNNVAKQALKKKKKESASLMAQLIKNPPAMQHTRVRSLGREDSLVKEMAIHSSILAWEIQWTEEPGGLQSMGSQESEITYRLNHHQTLICNSSRVKCKSNKST